MSANLDHFQQLRSVLEGLKQEIQALRQQYSQQSQPDIEALRKENRDLVQQLEASRKEVGN